MRRLICRPIVALLTFIIGIAATAGWVTLRRSPAQQAAPSTTVSLNHEIRQKPVETVAREIEPQTSTTFSSDLSFASKTVSEHVADLYSIEASYPQIEGLKDRSARQFNRALEKIVLRDVARFRELEIAADKKNRHAHHLIEESLGINYEIVFATKNVISLRLTETVMARGQMHPIDYYASINYDLNSGRFLDFDALFKPQAAYLTIFSCYCFNELKKKADQYFTKKWMAEGTAAQPDNFKNWNITPKGILISFEDYQVGPHSMGQPEIIVPYTEFQALLSPHSVVSSLFEQ